MTDIDPRAIVSDSARLGQNVRVGAFAVIGDEGVHAKCGDEFWRKLADAMSGYFRKGEFTPGIIHGVQKAGDLLAEHFPLRRG